MPRPDTAYGTLPLTDEHNRSLIENVHPQDWVNPRAAERYHLVVIGAGTAGLVTAAIGAAIGARVALIERHLMGGDCLNFGCVPSKAVIRAARAAAAAGAAAAFGVTPAAAPKIDFGAVMARMRRLRARISRNDSARRFEALGVDVFLGAARFVAPDRVQVGDQTLRFARAAICTGARPDAPSIPGLTEAGFLTNETIFNLTDRPARLGVIGGGPIGCELAQAFARLGVAVTLIEAGPRILPREEADAAELVRRQMQQDGVALEPGATIGRVERHGAETRLLLDGGRTVAVDALLVAVGRTPNVDGLGLEAAGVAFDARAGVQVDHRLRSSNARIFAAGDVCSAFKFTHAADAQAQVLIQNALFPHPFGLGYADHRALLIPRCTYTDPELAHVGLSAAEADARGLEVASFTQPLDAVDRAVLDGEETGFARLHVERRSGRIVGATVVAAHAGEIIGEVTVAMQAGMGAGGLTRVIHPYPTQAEAIRKAAVAWRKTTFTEGQKRLLKRWFGWMR
jgi:pyruvate/2-oxoglutarate dehydrogenase complex dihydrolipoamide dehydrogenase (E3) component